jgi:predicted transcriptional regulator
MAAPSVSDAAQTIESASRSLLRRAAAGDGAALLALHRASLALEGRATTAGVMLARNGATYADLGRLLGVTRQRARSRFRAPPDAALFGSGARPDRDNDALDVVRRLGGTATCATVAADLGINPSTAGTYLVRLARAGQLVRTARGTYRLTRVGERAANHEAAS